ICYGCTISVLLLAKQLLVCPCFSVLDATPLFMHDCVRRRGGSGHPHPDFMKKVVNTAVRLSGAKRWIGVGSMTAGDTASADLSAQSGTASAQTLVRTS